MEGSRTRAAEALGGRATGLEPQLDLLIAAKPKPRIAVIQGSFDWVHNGHLELIAGAANACDASGQPRFDQVVVVPTHEYPRKPFLKASFERRVAQLSEAIAERGMSDTVYASTVSARAGGSPAELAKALLGAYPEARFSYVLGSDSLIESAHWPHFDTVEQGMELLTVPREGHPLEGVDRAAGVLPPAQTRISSTEIRQALDQGNLAPILGRVPPSVVRGLEAELALRASSEPAAARLVNRARSSLSFEALKSAVPQGAPHLLEWVKEEALPERVRQLLADLQQSVNEDHRFIATCAFRLGEEQVPGEDGITDKARVIGEGPDGARRQFLFKRLSPEVAAKVGFVTLLSNIAGLPTPIATPYQLRLDCKAAGHGVLIPWVANLTLAENYDYAQATPKVMSYLLGTRWLNELIGNQDAWWKQFQVPRGVAAGADVLHIDLDNAFISRTPQWVQRALKDHWQKDAALADCEWTGMPFDFKGPVGWAPRYYDSMYTFYGPLWEAYLTGKADIDVQQVREQLQRLDELPPSVLISAMRPFLEVAARENYGKVPVQGEGKFRQPASFERAFTARFYRSKDEFIKFLDELEQSRNKPGTRLYDHYRTPPARAY